MPIRYEVVDVLEDRRPLFHCVSQDLAMKKGLAGQVCDQIGGVDLIRNQGPSVGKAIPVKASGRLVFHLISKVKYHHKPSILSLKSCLMDLRNKLIENDIYLIKAPKYVASGRDKLPWRSVLEVIDEVLTQSGIQVVLCALPNTPQGNLLRRS